VLCDVRPGALMQPDQGQSLLKVHGYSFTQCATLTLVSRKLGQQLQDCGKTNFKE